MSLAHLAPGLALGLVIGHAAQGRPVVGLIAAGLVLGALLSFALGRVAGRLALRPDPPLREAPRPAEACVEEWNGADESPAFTPPEIADLAARGYERRRR